jgi:hypothetical protein
MRRNRPRALASAFLFTMFLVFIIAFRLLSSMPSRAQSPRRASATAAADKLHILQGGFWRTDGGFVSTIRVKNALVVAPLDVTPVLFMADGTGILFAPYTLLSRASQPSTSTMP